MRMRLLAWILIPLLIGIAGYAAHSIAWGRHWAVFARSQPVLECPPLLELGERELGEVALGRFTIRNRGGGTLIIDEISTSCACTGLEREKDGKFVRLQSLRLGMSESADLVMRVLVQGTPGGSAENSVQFNTNDPSRAVTGIRVVVSKVNAGVTAIPTSVVFGKVPSGSESKRMLQLFDSAKTPRRIERVLSRNPDQLSVRLILSPGNASIPASKQGALVGQIEVIALTEKAGRINTDIEVHLAGTDRPPSLIPVSGRIVGPIETRPSMIVLPRASNAGLAYAGDCLCGSSTAEFVTLNIDSHPTDMQVSVETVHDNPNQRLVRAEWKPDESLSVRSPKTVNIRCRAVLRDSLLREREVLFDIPVVCLGNGS